MPAQLLKRSTSAPCSTKLWLAPWAAAGATSKGSRALQALHTRAWGHLEHRGQARVKALAAQVLRQQVLAAGHQPVLTQLPDELPPARASSAFALAPRLFCAATHGVLRSACHKPRQQPLLRRARAPVPAGPRARGGRADLPSCRSRSSLLASTVQKVR